MKKIRKALEFIKSPLFVGLLFTSLFCWVAWIFYQAKYNLEPDTFHKFIYDTVNWVDQKTIDARFVTRGLRAPQNKIALLAVDDQALAEVGRWPWDREVIAKITDNLMGNGAKSLGFDIIFSESQVNPAFKTLSNLETKMGSVPAELQSWISEQKKAANPDARLAEVLNKYRDKAVTATFFDGIEVGLTPFQDICYSEAFKKWPSYIIIEGRELPPFKFEEFAMYQEKVDFSVFFTGVFEKIHQTTISKILKDRFNKSSVEDLSNQETALLQNELQRADINYCARWLIEGQDEYLGDFKKAWSDLFKDIPELASVTPEEGIQIFQSTNLNIAVPQTGFWTANVAEIQKSTANVASINKEPDADGLMRKSQLLFRTGNEYIPSIALQTYLAAAGEQAHFTLIPDPRNPGQKVVGEFKLVNPETEATEIVPVDHRGQLQINYAGPQKMYPHLRASELLHDRPTIAVSQRVWDPELQIWKIVDSLVDRKEFIKDTIFIFGVTAIGVFDLRPTPFEKIFPGAEIHPNVI
ncbi:MAG: CHASE2 domain-containing protein, partial [Pseudobdellovibrionaceae bacterium]